MATKTKTITRRVYVKSKRRGRKKMTLPITLIAPLALTGVKTIQESMRVSPVFGANHLIGAMTGVRPDAKEYGWKTFDFKRMNDGAIPIGLGILVHKMAGPVNRALGRAGVPWIRL